MLHIKWRMDHNILVKSFGINNMDSSHYIYVIDGLNCAPLIRNVSKREL